MLEAIVKSGMRRRLDRFAVTLMALSLVARCEYPNNAINVENQSTQTLTLAMVSADTRIELSTLRPGEAHSLRNECVEMDFVVENDAGVELARRPGQHVKVIRPGSSRMNSWPLADTTLLTPPFQAPSTQTNQVSGERRVREPRILPARRTLNGQSGGLGPRVLC